MKLILVGDAAVSSGFARCTHAAADALHAAGHEVLVLGINYFGDPHPYPYKIFPCRQPLDSGYDSFGVTRLPGLMERYRPDLVVLLNDPWNVPGYLRAIKSCECPPEVDELWKDIPVVGWLAVDAKNQQGAPLNDLAHVITWTDFGLNELRLGGYTGPATVVPLGVDTSVFYPRDRAASRLSICPEALPQDAFLVGAVGRNQPRKRLDLTIGYFAEWIRQEQIQNAYLYLHVAPTGDKGVDIINLSRYYNLRGKVILATPSVGEGLDTVQLPAVYSAFDVCLTTTQGEGWGLTTMEAMACGVPCIVPNWSALGEWTRDAAMKVPCTSTAISAPLNTAAYTIGGVPSREGTIQALDVLYRQPILRARMSDRGHALVNLPWFQWSAIGKRLCMLLEDIHAGNQESATPPAEAEA